MKKTIPLILVVILVTACTQPQPETHQVEIGLFTSYYLFPEVLNGQVKEVVERSYLGIKEDDKFVKGERLTIGARDSIGWTLDFKLAYDADGNLIQSDNIDENDESINGNKLTVQDGKMIEGEYYESDTLRSTLKLKYNDMGVLSGMAQFRMPVDTLIRTNEMISDENGNFLEWRIHNAKGDPTTKIIFTVNEEGKRTGYSVYNKDGEKTFEQQYEYNEKGFLKTQVLINKAGDKSVSEYNYLEFDDMGNWTKYESHSDPVVMFTERTITYYEE